MKKLSVIILVFIAMGCQHVEKPERPDNLIARDVMVDILTDIYLSNAAKSANNKVIRQKGMKLDSFIYKKYRIDSLQFVKSHAYYNSDLDTYEEIFMEIEERLAALKAISDSLNPDKKFKQKQDSIKKATQLVEPAVSD